MYDKIKDMENKKSRKHTNLKKLDLKSFKSKVFITLMAFALIIIGLLWISQVIFLEYYLNNYKLGEFRTYANELSPFYGDDVKYMKAADKYGCTVDVIKKVGGEYVVEFTSSEFSFGKKNETAKNDHLIIEAEIKLADSNEALVKDSTSKHYYYFCNLPNGMILVIGQATEMIDSTVKILRIQMVIASITILVLITCMSVFINAIFGRDISKLSNSAKKLAQADYSVVFEENSTTEFGEIAKTLNYATQEMAVATKLRRELIANVSHDLRTPLTIIKGYAEMIKDITGDNKEKREQQLDVIIKETDRLTILVRDMLNLSQLEANPELEKKVVSLSDIVSDTFDSLSLYNETDGYNITAEIDNLLYVFADRTRLQLATYNLISNAINYTGNDKVVKIKLKKISDTKARFEVTDTGDGISEENIKQIWERYFRAKEHKRSVAGNGLGLSIVKVILDLHSAEFGVNSKIGEGSTFWYEIDIINTKI